MAADRLGVSTAALAAAARQRGIPVRRSGSLSLLRLGYGCHRRLVWAALTEQTSAVGVDIASDKVLAKELLAIAGVPVPAGVVARSAADAAAALGTLRAPLVIKPRNGNHGANVTVGVTYPGPGRRGVPAGQHAAAPRSSSRNMCLASTTGYSWWTGTWWLRPGCTRRR